jgi:hypothetical protein
MAAVTAALVASAVIAAASAAYQYKAAGDAAKAQSAAAAQQAQFAYQELDRQAGQVNQVAAEKKGDRARAADQEMSSLRAIMAEKGGLQTSTYESLVNQVGYVEGMDLSRIDTNAKNELDSIQAQKEKVHIGAAQAVEIADREALNARVGAGLQLASNALTLGYRYASREEEQATRKAPQTKPR